MTEPTAQRRPRYQSEQWQAWGTYVVLVVADARLTTAAVALTRTLMDHIDRTCSRFRDDTDLVRANRHAGEWVEVDPLLADAVSAALTAAVTTDGLVDPTLGLDLIDNGYDDDLDVVRARPDQPEQGTDPVALPNPPRLRGGWRHLEIAGTPDSTRLRVPVGCALDLGATGKAFAADLITTRIADQLGISCLLSLGGDVAVGAADDRAHQWQLSVSERPNDPVAEIIPLPVGGAATSTTLHRTWRHRGRTTHHLIDPRTGSAAVSSWRTATVLAPDCLQANTASTAALILGDRAPAWLAERGFAARLVSTEGNVHTVGTWPHPVTSSWSVQDGGAPGKHIDRTAVTTDGGRR